MRQFDLVGVDGNAFSVMGYVAKAMRQCKFSKRDIDSYYKDAMSSNYDHLLAASIDMIDRCNIVVSANESDDYED